MEEESDESNLNNLLRRQRRIYHFTGLWQSELLDHYRVFELSLGSSDWQSILQRLRSHETKPIRVGIRDVIAAEQLESLKNLPIDYIASPLCRASIAEKATRLGLPFMLSVVTPTEVQQASEWGSRWIRVFPAETFGHAYLQALTAPFNAIQFIADHATSEEDADSFVQHGCVASIIKLKRQTSQTPLNS